ncbi:PhoX family protein [Acinetobacter pittii]|uniref:PhoX family protein n=1 Tax=Acinetobacter pittii TaxID=48296 RepID=UPI0019000529|nr:alkaline phosphatase PhoX [Acinetobacter pittii]MBJ8434029.1 DUF839 domain-containing protein [Acinetobacter pittii]
MTTASTQPTRREILKWFSGIPFLPLGAMATAATLAGCNDSDDSSVITPTPQPSKFKNAKFTTMPAPTTAADRATTLVNSKLEIEWEDSTPTPYQLAYKPFFKTGDSVPKLGGGTIIAGGYFDVNGNPIMDKSVAGKERQFFSDCPDGSSLIQLEGAKVEGVANPVFHVVQFEYNSKDQAGGDTYGQLPSPIAILTLDQDQKTGHLELKKYFNVDTAPVHGLWITCGASLSPWNTHLSSEEYEPDAFNQGIGGTDPKYLGKYFFGDETKANPYNYGHLPEVTVNLDGTGSIKKHYCLGRISHELIHVMPDNRTALMGDDYTNGGFFMFVADKEKDLSAGTLYVAKYINTLTETSTASIQWIKLGHATSKEIEDLVAGGIKSTDIMESLTTNPNDASYTEITLAKKQLWVKLKPGMEKAAAFLETHRYAALKGASMAFTKMEGTNVNIKDKIAYSALANIQDSMVIGGKGYVAGHNVAFSKKITAGGVLAHKLGNSFTDNEGSAINSEWVPLYSYMLLMGEDLATADKLGNTANPDKIASPDNLKFSETLRTLFIGEDSGNHVNNFLWAYNVDTKELTRLLSTPAGAESTGLHAVDSINGWTYIMSNFQHPGDSSSVPEDVKALINQNYNNGYSANVGYITADPIAPSVTTK